MTPEHEERELKFTPGPAFRLPAFAGLADGVTVHAHEPTRLTASYFDTADLRLARAGASLRHRNDQGWVVKLPVARGDVLTRRELVVAGEPGAPPDAAVDLVLALIRGAPLELVARLDTVRHRTSVLDESGEQLAEIVDDEVSVLDGMRLAARFRELEVELGPADAPAVVADVVACLRAAGAGRPDPVPKIVRALGPRALEPGDLAAAPELDDASTPIEILRAAVISSTARLLAHDPGVRTGDDAEDVHQARVATRRLRSDLRTFHDVVDPEWIVPLHDELRWIGTLLGAVRDTDVLLERLDDLVDELPDDDADAGKRLLAGMRDHREEARGVLLDAMRSDRYLALLDRLVDAARAIPGPTSGEDVGIEVGDLVRRPWRRLQRAVDALDDDPPDTELHAVRILAKRCRYAAEAVAPAIGAPARRFAGRIAALQEVLGEHQDAVIAERWLRDHAFDSGELDVAFVAGELATLEVLNAETSRAEWADVWERAARPGLRRWM